MKHEFGYGDHALVDWGNFCREVAVKEVMRRSSRIGGPGKTVEIDESLFNKSKSTTRDRFT